MYIFFFITTGSFSKTSTYNQFREGKPPSPTTRDKRLDKRMEGSLNFFHTPTKGVKAALTLTAIQNSKSLKRQLEPSGYAQ